MRQRLKQSFVAVALLAAASSAAAHGVEGLIQSIVIVAVLFGVLGGIVTGALGSHPGYGLLTTIGVLLGAGLVYLLVDVGGSADVLGILGMMLTLTAFAGVIPLVIVFFIAFGVATILRGCLWEPHKKNEPAP